MNDAEQFRVVLRGYDPVQVNQRLEELVAVLEQTAKQRDELLTQLKAGPQPEVSSEPPTYEHLGARVGKILTLADEEAGDLRRRADEEIAAKRAEVETEAARIRDETDRYAVDTRSHAETEAARIVEDARRTADERIDNAERDAAAKTQEADALFEEQRARAVQAAADFETTLAARRKSAEEEFTRQMGEVQRQLDEANRTLEGARAEADVTRESAKAEADKLVRTAMDQAQEILDDVKAKADHVRAESDRELQAATQRRDAINAQLGNVRQMLATLTGSAAALDPFESEAQEPEPSQDTHLAKSAQKPE